MKFVPDNTAWHALGAEPDYYLQAGDLAVDQNGAQYLVGNCRAGNLRMSVETGACGCCGWDDDVWGYLPVAEWAPLVNKKENEDG